MEELDLMAVLTEHATRHGIPGAALAVLHEGVVTTAYHGVSDLATGEPVSEDTRFAIGSVTKWMTAALILRLEREGRISIDESVAQHAPELSEAKWAEQATIRDLLANRSRIPLRAQWEFALEGDGNDALNKCAVLTATAESAADVWSYSNMGWCLMGRIIEGCTGVLWEEALESSVLRPAGLSRTIFALSPVAESRATGHRMDRGDIEPVPAWTPRIYCSAGTSLLSTVGDLVRFAAWQLETPNLGRLCETHAEVAIHGWLDAWGLGVARFDWLGGPVWGWDGVVPGQRTFLRLLPEQSAAIALATNGSWGRAMYRSLFTDLLGSFDLDMAPLSLEPAPCENLERYAGTYAWPDRRCEVRPAGESLAIEIDGRTLDATPVSDRVFMIDASDPDNPTVTFDAFDDQGAPGVIYMMLWGMARS